MAWVTYRMKIWRRLAQGVSESRRFKFKGFGYPRIFKRRNYTLDPIWNVLEVQERAWGSLAVSISPCRVWWGSESDCARHATGGAKSDDELFVTGRLQLCPMHMLWYFDLVGGGRFWRSSPCTDWGMKFGLLHAEYHVPHRCRVKCAPPPLKKLPNFYLTLQWSCIRRSLVLQVQLSRDAFCAILHRRRRCYVAYVTSSLLWRRRYVRSIDVTCDFNCMRRALLAGLHARI